MNQEKIGKFISTLRKNKKLTQEQLGERLGVTSKSISRWENGKTMPDLSLLLPLAKELDISVNELLSGEYLNPEIYQEQLENNMINSLIYFKKDMKKKIKRTILIIIPIIVITIALIILGITFVLEYKQSPIYLEKEKIKFEICDYNQKYYLLSIKTKDELNAFFDIKTNEKMHTKNIMVYRTRESMKDINKLQTENIGNVLIEKEIEKIYYRDKLLWSREEPVSFCNELVK